MKIVDATTREIPAWLDLCREVEPLFGPMPNFLSTLENKINQRAAICVLRPSIDAGDEFVGGALLGGMSPDFWIRWLAVRRSSRNHGAGSALISEALIRFLPPCRISVDTFRDDSVWGKPARRLYERFGFLPGELIED